MNFTFLKILVKKEFVQIAKDRSALVIAFLMPLILVVIYGYAMRMDIKPVKVGFVSDLGSKIERDLLGGFLGSKYLQTRVYTDLESARRDFRAHEIESILYFDPLFAPPRATQAIFKILAAAKMSVHLRTEAQTPARRAA